jgi:hypothetical protein
MIVNYISTSLNSGQTHYTVNIPKFSSIVDINIGKYGQIYITYLKDDDLNNSSKEIYLILFNQSSISNLYIPDNYKFFKTIQDLNIDSNVVSSGRSVTIDSILDQENYLVFIDENKQVDEIREEKINEITMDCY